MTRPRTLFLIDGFGALISAFLLGVVLTKFESVFGMPRSVLFYLAGLACLFAVYDLICYIKVHKNWPFFLQVIAMINLFYALLSIGLVVYHFQKLTAWGLIYFLLEIAVVILLAVIEFRAARRKGF